MSLCIECRLLLHRRLQSHLSNFNIRRASSAKLVAGCAQNRPSSTFTEARRNDDQSASPSFRGTESRRYRPRGENATPKALPVDQILDADLSLDETRNLRRQLLWLKDPAKLAERVRTVLAKDKLQQAINLVRLASTADHKPIVAWNAILGYLAGRRYYKAAFKIYNEMKKRAQYPDSYSVVHLLRGLASEPVSAEQVRLAIKLHDSLDATNSKVAKSIIHTNAALQVCVNASDHDAMWTLISKLPEQGSGAADQTTFTVILSALKRAVLEKPKSDKDFHEFLAKNIADGRNLWQDIIHRANKRQLDVDAQLVCGYSSLLLLDATPASALEVLSVIETSTGISRQEQPSQKDSIDSDRSRISGSGVRLRRTKPNAQIASLLFKAIYEIRRSRYESPIRSGYSYWTALTSSNDLEPDPENYHGLLRVLAAEGDSAHASEIINEMRSRGASERTMDYVNRGSLRIAPQRTAYLLAFTACAKDATRHRNRTITKGDREVPSPLQRANAIMDIMVADGKLAALKPVTKFLDCAISSHSAYQVHAALQKVMQILDKQLGGEGAHEGFLQVPVDSIGDKENLLKLTLETIRALLSHEGRAALETAGAEEQQVKDLKGWQRQMDVWLQTYKIPRGKAIMPELGSLRNFSQALASQQRAK